MRHPMAVTPSINPEWYQRYTVFKETLRKRATSSGFRSVFRGKSPNSVSSPRMASGHQLYLA